MTHKEEAGLSITAEFGTPTARGVFLVGDRQFVDRRLTRKEKRLFMARALFSTEEGEDPNVPFLLHMLQALRLRDSDPDVTLEWLESTLTDGEIALAVTYILQGPDGVRKVLQSVQESLTSENRPASTP